METSLTKHTKDIIESILKTSPISMAPLGMNIGGSVMKVETENGVFVVKLIPNCNLPSLETEAVNERVYSARWTEFEPAYAALKATHLPLPTIHTTGYTKSGSHYFILMEYIVGESVREYMPNAAEDTGFHRAVGETLGKLHRSTREYQGWISMKTPYQQSWGAAFFASLENQIRELESHNFMNNEEVSRLREFTLKYQTEWTEPNEFVLSHLDGFQGIATKHTTGWSIDGIIDIEDHQFTDQRFVLCGHELAMETEGHSLPASFWEAYSSAKALDPTFQQLKPIFKLYYLLAWLCVFEDKSIGDIPDRETKAENTKRMINMILAV